MTTKVTTNMNAQVKSKRIPVLSIHGLSGSGKDTLAKEIGELMGNRRVSFGDFIRVELGESGFPAPDDERSPQYQTGRSYKDLMVDYGRSMSLLDPMRYVHMMDEYLTDAHATMNQPDGVREMLVITDCRRPVEFEMLRDNPLLDLWCVRLPNREGSKLMPLDDLLGNYRIKALSDTNGVPFLDQVIDHIIGTAPLN